MVYCILCNTSEEDSNRFKMEDKGKLTNRVRKKLKKEVGVLLAFDQIVVKCTICCNNNDSKINLAIYFINFQNSSIKI